MISFLKFLKEIVCIEPMKTKLVQSVYFKWMAVKLKSQKWPNYTLHMLLHKKKILLAGTAIETSYPANVEVNLR